MKDNRRFFATVVFTVLFVFGGINVSQALTRDEVIADFCLGSEFFVVNSVEDDEDLEGCSVAPEEGDCTLREAINAANLCPAGSPGEIRLEQFAYSLRTWGFAEPIFVERGPAAGGRSALPIHGDVIIYGNGATIERGAETEQFRIFEVRPGARLVLMETTVRGGRANVGRTGIGKFGGAVFVMNQGTLSLYGSVIEGNEAGDEGGGIYNAGLTRLHASTVRNNGSVRGGGIKNFRGRLEIIQSTMSGNSQIGLGGFGGAIENLNGSVMIKSSTISGNLANRAGAINHQGPRGTVEMEIRDTTIFGNESTDPTSGALALFGGARITNSIVANNTPKDCLIVLDYTFESRGVNLDGDGSCGLSPALRFDITTDPLLLPLANYGGPTDTHPPDFQSPAVDAAMFEPGEGCEAVDQRFRPRPKDGNASGEAVCDIGAFEVLSIGETAFEDIADPIGRRGSPSRGLIRRRLFGP